MKIQEAEVDALVVGLQVNAEQPFGVEGEIEGVAQFKVGVDLDEA